MSLVVFLVLSVIFIGSLYYFMFVAPANKGTASDQAPDPKKEEPKVLNRGAAARLRNRRATTNTDSDSVGEEEEENKFD